MTHRLDPRAVDALARQRGVEYFDTHFTSDNPHLGEYWGEFKNMMLNWQKMERLAKGYDKVWMVDDDVIPPDDALQKLLEVDADVVSGLYASRHAPYDPNIIRKKPNVFYTWDEVKALGDKTITVEGSGAGCLLLSRSFLDRYKIDMVGYERPREVKYERMLIDLLLNSFCQRNGIEQKVRLDVQCGHKKANGEILWPQDFMN